MGLGLSLGLSLGSRGGASTAAWYTLGKADNTDPSFWADFENNRYAVNGSEEAFSDIFTFTRSTTGTYFDNTGVMQTAAINAPRFDHDPVSHAPKGILIEEQRTNKVRNGSLTGSVAGSPGSLPTYWWVGGSGFAGLTRQIVGSGFESGIPYVDVRYSGSPTFSGTSIMYMEDMNVIAAAQSQTWTATTYMKIASGDLTNCWIRFGMYERDSSGTGLNALWDIIPITSNLTRYTSTKTTTHALTAFVVPLVALIHISGQAIDITLRIGGAQLEQGTFATSYIPTTTAAVTRGADSVANTGSNTVPFSSWYNSSAGTVYTDFNYYGSDNSFPRIFDINDTVSNSNMISLLQDTSAQQASYNIYSSSVYQGMSIGAPDLRGSRRKFAGTVALNNAAAVINGGALNIDTLVTMPVSLIRMDVGNTSSGTRGACLHIRELRYYPIRVSNASLQELTS